jgi:hypothetical protein
MPHRAQSELKLLQGDGGSRVANPPYDSGFVGRMERSETRRLTGKPNSGGLRFANPRYYGAKDQSQIWPLPGCVTT